MGTLPIRAVLFDLDNTLNDRDASWMRFVKWLAGPGGHLRACNIKDVHVAILGADDGGYRPKLELFCDLRDQLPWRSPMTSEAIEQLWRDQFPSCTVVRENVFAVLGRIRQRGLRTAIVSNGRADAQRAKIKQMRVGNLIDAVIISEEVGTRKPDAAIFHSALEQIGVAATEAMFVGDHPLLDVVGPAKVGIRTAWLSNGRDWPLHDARPDFRIHELTELSSLLT